MNRLMIAGRPVVARALVAAIVSSIVVACTGGTASSPSAEPSAARTPSARPSERATLAPTPAPVFPTAVFADLSSDPVSAATAAKFQAALETMAGAGGMTATVMTMEGTWSGAAGKADGVHDLKAESQFGIASITKSVVAAQVMLLVEAGELRLDNPASDYLPADFEFDTNGATIRQLLSMYAGIPDWYGGAMEREMAANRLRVWTTAEVLDLVGPSRTIPGMGFEYTDTNYTLLGIVIEHVRKRPLFDVLRDGVLNVEGTRRLIYQPDEAPTDPMAMPLGESRGALKAGGGYLPSMSDASSAGPAGALASDSISLARWWRAFCAGEIVSAASLTEMSTFIGGTDGYGLGLFNVADPWGFGFGHTGGNFGYASWAGCMPADHAVVVMLANQWIDDLGGAARPLITALHTT